MKYDFIKAHSGEHAITTMCKVLSVTSAGYYAWKQRGKSRREQADEVLVDQIKKLHELSKKNYGSPRITNEINKTPNKVGRNRVARLMREHGIQGKKKRSFRPQTTQSGHQLPVAPNRLNQDFKAERPGERLVADITYIKTLEGWLYLCVVLDLFSRRVIGWFMMNTMPQEIVISALDMATGRCAIRAGAIFHSDRGSQFAAQSVRDLLAANQMLQSMSRKGNVWDNAVMESFFATLKTECIPREGYATREEARRAIFEWIEIFYNRQRSHSTLGYLSPTQFELATMAAWLN